MRVLAVLVFAAVLSCATSAAPNSVVGNKRFIDIGGILSPVVDTVVDVIPPVTCALQPILGDLLQTVSDLITGSLTAVQQLIGSLTGLLRQAGLLEPLADLVDDLIPTVEAALSGLVNGLTCALEPVVKLVYNLISGFLNGIDDLNIPLISNIVSTLGSILDKVFEIASELLLRQILSTLLLPEVPSLTPSGSALVEVGVSLTLTCQTIREDSITYTFLQDGTEVQSSASNIYNVSSLDTTDSGTYTCKVSSSEGNATSTDSYVLNVVDLSMTPSGGCRVEGEDIPVTVTCAAISNGSFTYTFFRNGTEVQSSASTTYTISSPQTSDAGTYTCKISNNAGEVTSSDSYSLYILVPHDKTVIPPVPGMDQRFQPLCYQDTLYYIHEDSFSNLNTSLSKCQQEGGMLAEFNDIDEINALKAYLDGLPDIDKDNLYVFIGAYYDANTQQWRLPSTGEVLPVTDWLPGEPYEGASRLNNCVMFTRSGVWGMYTFLCSVNHPDDIVRFICEKQFT